MNRMMNLLKASLVMLAFIVIIFIGVSLSNSGNKTNASHDSKNHRESSLSGTVESKANIPEQVLPSLNNSATGSTVPIIKADYIEPEAKAKEVEAPATPPTTAAREDKEEQTEEAFDKNFYPYRTMLKPNQQRAYDQIYNEINSLTKDVSLVSYLDTAGIKAVMEAIFNDHPELFWIETSYIYGYTNQGDVISVSLKYNSTADDISASRTKFQAATNRIINKASNYKTDLEKEKYVYDELQKTCEYNAASELNQSAYSCAVNGESVCSGFSRAFQYIMIQLKIPCYFVTGTAQGGAHAWNIVEIGGNFYNVDLSWDATLSKQLGTFSYSYFNISDNTIGMDHKRGETSAKLPACKATLQ